MDVEKTLCTAPPDPLPVLMRAELISGDAGVSKMGGGHAQLTELGNPEQQCGGNSRDLNSDHDLGTTLITSQCTKPVAPHVTPVCNNFTEIRQFEKKSWHSKSSEAPFFCRLCRRSRPKGTMFIGILPVGGTRGQDWQQICAEPGVEKGVAGKLTFSCIAKYTETISASAALDREERREERQELEELVAGACPRLPPPPPRLQPATSSSPVPRDLCRGI
jgi:hypothetical protein